MADAPTPSMQQYLKAKAEHPDCIVLFRMGDFYETFYDDAVEAATLLDLALTSRNKDDPNPIPMAGVPYHAIQGYLSRLVEAGRKVAICEQMEDPRQAKGIVRREVVRVVTPGVALDTEIADPTRANHLVCVLADGRGFALAALDASTGDLRGAFVTTTDDLRMALGRLVVREVLVPAGGFGDAADVIDDAVREAGAIRTDLRLADMDAEDLDAAALAVLPPPTPPSLRAAATAVMAYLGRTHAALVATVRPFAALAVGSTMTLPMTTVRNLELLASAAGGRSGPSLLGFLNQTRTGMGARLLRTWLLAPLTDPNAINARLERVQALVLEPTVRDGIRAALTGTPDLERLLTRLAGGSASARDLNAIARGVRTLRTVCDLLARSDQPALSGIAAVDPALVDLAQGIQDTFVEDPPPTTRDGGMVRRGVRPDLDAALDMAEHGRAYIARYEAEQRERTGIPTLKVRYNRVFGYTIEVSRGQSARVPDDYQRRQTLANAERYTTTALSELESQVATADERSVAIQQQTFDDWRERVLAARVQVQGLADALAAIDVPCCMADLAQRHDWCRPQVAADRGLSITDGRHPIVEDALPRGTFVPNDFDLDGESCTLTIITGPNMSGKSTIMRQVALIVLLAQMGSFVPARRARIGVADAIFTRVGAMDDLAAGRSTFMVEMSEAAEMLSRATDRSLVILDEIGRGTSTFDGVAIAWAVAEHIQARIGCRTLFATHYHELTDLVRSVPRARNCSVAVREWGGEVLFLRKLVDGPASKSYGIQVARLAGLPDEVIARAREVLANLEAAELDAVGRPRLARGRRESLRTATGQLDLFAAAAEAPDPLVLRLGALDPERMTPLDALQVLTDLVAAARSQVPGRSGDG